MNIFNKYTYLFLGLIISALLVVFTIIPRFETQEFDKNRVKDIAEGITTTTISGSPADVSQEEVADQLGADIDEVEKSEIEKLLLNNKAKFEITGYKSYLLIGSDERDSNSSASRGFVEGQRADVIIIGLISDTSDKHYLLSIPRDTLIINACTDSLERINSSYSKNKCGNNVENLAASVQGITGISIDHFASFNFEGFENIIDSFDGIEVCVDEAQREGYSFELKKGCQTISGSTALNWIVSRNTEVLVGPKILNENGDDASSWKKMEGVSDLSRNDRQQYVILQLLNKVSEFSSIAELNSFINTLEDSFTIDKNLTLNRAIETLWNFRNIDLEKINKLSLPTYPYELQDGRQVLIISENFSDYTSQNGLLIP